MLRQVRLDAGLTQDEVDSAIGTSKTTITFLFQRRAKSSSLRN